MLEFINTYPIYGYLFIFLARVVDVSLDVFRLLLLTRGYAVQASVLGFVEICIFIIALNSVLSGGPMDILKILAYAGGFATGNLVGAFIEEKMAVGYVVIHIFTSQDGYQGLSALLRQNNYGVTSIAGQGRSGPREILIITTKRRDLPNLLQVLHNTTPEVFYSVSDIRTIRGGIFPNRRP